jgi:cytochrome c oxidase subunit III
MSLAPRKIDASLLTDSVWDARAPLWWGNTLMIFIETVTMVLLFASYFYVRRNFWEWPPPRVDQGPPMLEPVPKLLAGTINVVMIVLSCAVMYWTDQAARKTDRPKVTVGLIIMTLVTLASLVLRGFEFKDLHFRWDDNAYASNVWAILFMHLVYLIGAFGEFVIVLIWCLLRRPFDEKHGLDVTLMGGYWYWLVGIWVPAYFIVYWYPRWS